MLDHEQILSKLSPKDKPLTKEDDEQHNSTLVETTEQRKNQRDAQNMYT